MNRYMKSYGVSVEADIKKKLSRMPYVNKETEAFIINSLIQKLET